MPPVEKYCEFEMKKGRFSENVVSNTERLTTAGSTSTCPKAGFKVASSVRFEVRWIWASPPIRLVSWELEWYGSPGCARSNLLLEVAYGTNSICVGRELTVIPSNVPKNAGPPYSLFRQNAHMSDSLRRSMVRQICIPHT